MCVSQQNEKIVRETKINSESLKKTWSQDEDTVYIIPNGIETVRYSCFPFINRIENYKVTIEEGVNAFVGDKLIDVDECPCGCGDTRLFFVIEDNFWEVLILSVSERDVLAIPSEIFCEVMSEHMERNGHINV